MSWRSVLCISLSLNQQATTRTFPAMLYIETVLRKAWCHYVIKLLCWLSFWFYIPDVVCLLSYPSGLWPSVLHPVSSLPSYSFLFPPIPSYTLLCPPIPSHSFLFHPIPSYTLIFPPNASYSLPYLPVFTGVQHAIEAHSQCASCIEM